MYYICFHQFYISKIPINITLGLGENFSCSPDSGCNLILNNLDSEMKNRYMCYFRFIFYMFCVNSIFATEMSQRFVTSSTKVLVIKEGWQKSDYVYKSCFSVIPFCTKDKRVLLDLELMKTNIAPKANFNYSCKALSCSFDASSSSDIDGTIKNYVWSFGATGVTASNVFPSSGLHSVTLTVDDNQGELSSLTRYVNLHILTN